MTIPFFLVYVKAPSRRHRVAGHTPVSSGRKRNGTDLGTVRYAGTLELLGEEAAIEFLLPFHDGLAVKFAFKGACCHTVELFGRIALADRIIEEEVVQIVGTDDILGLLRDLAVLGGKKLGADGGIENVKQTSLCLTGVSRMSSRQAFASPSIVLAK